MSENAVLSLGVLYSSKTLAFRERKSEIKTRTIPDEPLIFYCFSSLYPPPPATTEAVDPLARAAASHVHGSAGQDVRRVAPPRSADAHVHGDLHAGERRHLEHRICEASLAYGAIC